MATDASTSNAPSAEARLVIVTGRAGAGRSTAINALEDAGFETVDRPPLNFIPAILRQATQAAGHGVALGVDCRTIGFTPSAFAEMVAQLRAEASVSPAQNARPVVIFLDCDEETLRRRYTETRRRHPLALEGALEEGLAKDRAMMLPLQDLADIRIDSSHLTPTDLRRVIQERLSDASSPGLSISVQSFAYRNGLPPEADLVFDCRFLRNPHYIPELKPLDGRTASVAEYVSSDPNYPDFMSHLTEMANSLLPAFAREGKSYVTWAFGCTGGKHRSVAVAEAFAKAIANKGWTPRIRHREREAAEKPLQKT